MNQASGVDPTNNRVAIDASDNGSILAVCIFLVAIVWMVFGQTLKHQFINYDDTAYVVDNAAVAKGLTANGLASAFTQSDLFLWTPLTRISHMVDVQLFKMKPAGHHFTNVLLHSATAILLFLVLLRMTSGTGPTSNIWTSAFVAALFAIHPLHVESVAWIAERKDVLSGLFFMLTLWAYERYVRKSRSLGWYLAVVIFFALGLLSKPMLVTLPFVLLLLDYWPLGRFQQAEVNGSLGANFTAGDREAFTNRPREAGDSVLVKTEQSVVRGPWSVVSGRTSAVWWGLIKEKIPLFVLSAAWVCRSLFDLVTWNGETPVFGGPSLSLRIGNAFVSYAVYLKQMVYPVGLAVRYPFPIHGVPIWQIIASLLLLGAISSLAYLARRGRPYLLIGWLWYLGMMVPVIGVLELGGEARADRYTYLPHIGLYVLVTWAVADLSVGWRRRREVLGFGGAVVIAALIWCARVQTSYWRDSESLWIHTLAVAPDNYLPQNNLGVHSVQKGRVEDAITRFQTALSINPNYAESHNNLGNALLLKGQVDEAISRFEKAIALRPRYAEAHYNLANAFLRNGKADEAIAHYQKALAIDPDYAAAHSNFANVLARKGQMDEAIGHYQKAISIKPEYADAHNNLGNALMRKGQVDEAIAHFRKAVTVKPGFAEAHGNLSNALLRKGRVDDAIAESRQAVVLKPDYVEGHNSLGSAFLEKGNVHDAITEYEKALILQPANVSGLNNLAWALATSPNPSPRIGRSAVELAEQANQLSGGNHPLVLRTLAGAYADAGRFSDAVETAQKGIQVAQSQGDAQLAAMIQSDLKFYQGKIPLRIAPKPDVAPDRP